MINDIDNTEFVSEENTEYMIFMKIIDWKALYAKNFGKVT